MAGSRCFEAARIIDHHFACARRMDRDIKGNALG
jgi:hypothetical protein